MKIRPSYPSLAELVRDLTGVLGSIPDTEIFEYTGQYIESLTLKLPRAPRAIELVRCVKPSAPGVTTGHGTAVEWIWASTGARVLRIDGLTTGATPYAFTFRVTY